MVSAPHNCVFCEVIAGQVPVSGIHHDDVGLFVPATPPETWM